LLGRALHKSGADDPQRKRPANKRSWVPARKPLDFRDELIQIFVAQVRRCAVDLVCRSVSILSERDLLVSQFAADRADRLGRRVESLGGLADLGR
jgi:hypothetical protein